MGGYIPAPSKGVLDVQAATPDAKPGRAWLDVDSGAMKHWSVMLNEWVPVGEPSPMIGFHALALGRAVPGDTFSVAIGHVPDKTGQMSIVIGSSTMGPSGGARALGYGCVVIGANATAGTDSFSSSHIVIGDTAKTGNSSHGVAIGSRAEVDSNSPLSVALGYQATVGAPGTGGNGVAIGANAVVNGVNSVAIGVSSKTPGDASNATALGNNASAAGSNSTALGTHSDVAAGAVNSTALGSGAHASGTNAVALGSATAAGTNVFAVGNGASATHTNSVAIGSGATSTADNRLTYGGESIEVVSPGGAILLRSPNGTLYAITVSNAGAVTATAV